MDILDLTALAERFAAEAAAMRAYLAALTDAGLAEPLRYAVSGQQRERVRWHVLFHVVNHGTHHRGEAAAALTAGGSSPGERYVTVFLSSRQMAEE